MKPFRITGLPPADADDLRWTTVAERRAQTAFLFGVRTTGVFCRTGCPSRTPARRNVSYFPDATSARAAGFRACKRCVPDERDADDAMRRTIERAARRLAGEDGASIDAIARDAGLSRFHFQRTFRRITGVTPGAYARAHRRERLAAALRSGSAVSDAVLDAGFGSTGRAYDTGVLGMRPRALRAGGQGERIAYAIAACSLGRVLAATTPRGVCAIELGNDDADVLAAFAQHFPAARRERDDAALAPILAAVVGLVDDPSAVPDLALDVRGTAFQQRVWSELRAIAPGERLTYAGIAQRVGVPGGAQAVGAACAANRLAVAIPCHRVVRSDGTLAGYRWGEARKRALLDREMRAHAGAPATSAPSATATRSRSRRRN